MDKGFTGQIKFPIYNKSAYAKNSYLKGFFLNILQKLQDILKSKLELHSDYSTQDFKINPLLYQIYKKSDIITKSLIVMSCQSNLFELYINIKNMKISHGFTGYDDGTCTSIRFTDETPCVIRNCGDIINISFLEMLLPETLVSSFAGQPLKNIIEMPPMFEKLGEQPIISTDQYEHALIIHIEKESVNVALPGKKEIGFVHRYLRLKAIESVAKEIPFQIYLIVGILAFIKFFMIYIYDPTLMIVAQMLLGFIIGVSLFTLFIACIMYRRKMESIKKSITINIPE